MITKCTHRTIVALACGALLAGPTALLAQSGGTTVPAANCVTGPIIQQAAESARQT